MWNETIAWWIDVAKAGGAFPLLQANTLYAGVNPSMIQGQYIKLQLWFRTIDTVDLIKTSNSVTLPAGAVIIVSGKEKGALDSAPLLFYASSFTPVEDDGETYYEGDLGLNTEEIDEFLDADSDDIRIEIVVQDPDDTYRSKFQFDARLYRQIYATGETPPALGTPTGGLQRVHAGEWQVKDVTTGLWHGFWLDNGVLTIGTGEE